MTIVVLLVIYYLMIIMIYFRSDVVVHLKKVVAKKTDIKVPVPGKRNEYSSSEVLTRDPDPKLISAVHELMDALPGVFIRAQKRHSPKEELLMALKAEVRRYPLLKGSIFEAPLNAHIVAESLDCCATELTTSDLEQIW